MSKKKSGFKRFWWIGLILIAILIAFGISQVTLPTGVDAVFCDDYEFFCCNEIKYPLNPVNRHVEDEDPYVCPLTTTKCEILSSEDLPDRTDYFVGSGFCRIESCAFGLGRYYKCSNEFKGRETANPGDKIYLRQSEQNPCANREGYLEVQNYKKQLQYTGSSAASTGIKVPGEDMCKFNPETDKIYSTEGKVEFVDEYSVPLATCILSYSGDRHICGFKSETCDPTEPDKTECGGHKYDNIECSGIMKETYGCQGFGTEIFSHDRLPWESGWGSDDTQSDYNTFGYRCGIIDAETVSCCSSDPCGPGMYCDILESWTCKEESGYCTKATEATICGVVTVCDWTKKELVEPFCDLTTHKCSEKTTPVDCCLDSNCLSEEYCDANYECQTSIVPKQECPVECCVDEEQYYDKPCPANQFCVAGECVSEPECNGKPCDKGMECIEGICKEKIGQEACIKKAEEQSWMGWEWVTVTPWWSKIPVIGYFAKEEAYCKATFLIYYILGVVVLVLGTITILLIRKPKYKNERRFKK